MRNNEDYLDDLLSSVSNANRRNNKKDIEDLIQSMNEETAKPKKKERKRRARGADGGEYFVREFEQELAMGGADEFLEQFEMELEEEAAASQPDIDLNEAAQDKIGNGQKEDRQEAVMPDAPDVSNIMDGVKRMVDTAESGEEVNADGSNLSMESAVEADGSDAVILPEDGLMDAQDGAGLEQLLSDNDELVDIGKLLQADASGEAVSDEDGLMSLEELQAMGEEPEDDRDEFERLGSIEELQDLKKGRKGKNGKKDRKDQKSNGLLSRMAQLFFGPEEDDIVVPEESELGNISDENMDILKALDASEGKGQKGKKKKEKKAKKGKDSDDSAPKEKKPKKPKKEKPPKVKDNTPPLPKKPVILIGVLAASVLALILLGSSNIQYEQDIRTAKDYYNAGDYVKAYETLAGSNTKDKDEMLYQRTLMLASVQSEYSAYQNMAQMEKYEFALDALVRGVGRYDNYSRDAQEYEAQAEMGLLKDQITQALSDSFGVTEEQAMELLKMRKRTEYTVAIRQILDNQGLPY